MVGEDDFVELDESGSPRRKAARGGAPSRGRPQPPVRRKPGAVRRRPDEVPAVAPVAAEGAVPAPLVDDAELDEPGADLPVAPVKEAAPLRRRPVPANPGAPRRGGAR
jgi:hypothetical protein